MREVYHTPRPTRNRKLGERARDGRACRGREGERPREPLPGSASHEKPWKAGRASVHASRYCTTTLPANPSNLFPADGAKYNGTSPANVSASAATNGTTTVEHVDL